MSGIGNMGMDYSLTHEREFDALLLDVRDDGDELSKKYPAKLHARKVAAKMRASNGIIFLPGNTTRYYEDSDQGPAFRQWRYFYYMSGVDLPGCFVAYELDHDRLTLFIPFPPPREALYFGSPPDAARARRLYDVDDVLCSSEMPYFLDARLGPGSTLFVLRRDQAPLILERHLASRRAAFDWMRLRPAMDAARAIKSPHEIALVRRANAVSSAAHRAVAERLLALRNEQDAEAAVLAACLSRGAHRQAYPVIAGSGGNAATLHYGANDQPLQGRQLLLVDAGCEWGCYASDVTRTLPLGGGFSREAAQIHDVVARMQDECVARVAPGVLFYQLHLHAAAVARRGLLALGVLRGDEREVAAAGTVAAFFPHGLGHHVGLEVHDVDPARDPREEMLPGAEELRGGKRQRISADGLRRMAGTRGAGRPLRGLQPNMIITIEPGIYFNRDYIEGYFLQDETHRKFVDTEVLARYYDVGGVRIEDCILVTEDGHENLTTAPKGEELLKIINGGFEHV